MNNLISTILIGIGLSMDAFSLSILYGTLQFTKTKTYLISIIVGLYHFFMPLIGISIGGKIKEIVYIEYSKIVFFLFLLIGIEMLKPINEKNINIKTSLLGIIIFGFSVSLDSLTVGIGLEYIDVNHLLSSTIFMLCSSFFTLLGLNFGKIFSEKVKKYPSVVGGIIFILIAMYYLFNKQ